jgi:ketosteroid isomerase-like protein
MIRLWPSTVTGIITAALLCAPNIGSGVFAETRLLPGMQAEANDKTVKEILAVFERAEQAVKNHDLEGVMAVYSKRYNYHGLKKPDIRKIWTNLFDNYKEIESTHLFSRIVPAGAGDIIEVTCSGGVRGVSKTGNLRVPIDSWYDEIHYMTKEDGTWKIRGNLGDAQTVLPFGTAPHPLF